MLARSILRETESLTIAKDRKNRISEQNVRGRAFATEPTERTEIRDQTRVWFTRSLSGLCDLCGKFLTSALKILIALNIPLCYS